MVDIGVWIDEFLYWLFEHLNTMNEKESKSLQRSISKLSEETDQEKYYHIVTMQS